MQQTAHSVARGFIPAGLRSSPPQENNLNQSDKLG